MPEEDLNPHNQSCPLPKNRGHKLSLISNSHICPDGHRVTLTQQDHEGGLVSLPSIIVKSPILERTGLLYYAGDHLISHTLTRAVPSAQRGLTSVFGMGTGVTLAVNSPAKFRNFALAIFHN